ncbi:MAG: lipopolysaccharide transport periplasmic protein LptA [Desulfobacteraceae bacterium]
MLPLNGVVAQTGPDEESPEAEDERLVIHSQTLEINNKARTVLFTGDVDARKSTFTIKCREMLLYYQDDAEGDADAAEGMNVEKAEATGDVVITRADGGRAMADKAVYYQAEEKIVLTGNPVVKQGEDFVEGSRIIFFVRENRSIVEGSDKERVRAVIFPDREER